MTDTVSDTVSDADFFMNAPLGELDEVSDADFFMNAPLSELDEAPTQIQNNYIPVPPTDFEAPESIYLEEHDETIEVPAGGSAIAATIMGDDLFDTPGEPSSAVEEATATFEKQAAYLALVANSWGLVGDEEVVDFFVDRSLALASAQQRQPKHMKDFQEKWNKSEGFFESAGVMIDHPAAIGRIAFSSSANGAASLVTGLTTMGAGFVVGGLPGAVVGLGGGTFAGTLVTEVGAEIDGMMAEAGVDPTNREQMLSALQNDAFMKEIQAKATRKGLGTATVDALFSMFGGKVVKTLIPSPSTLGKTGRAVGGVSVDVVGEGAGEGAGQLAKDGEVSGKDIALEMVASMGPSTGQAGLSAAVSGGVGLKKKKDEKKAAAKTVAEEAAVTKATESVPEVTEEIATTVKVPEGAEKLVEAYTQGEEVDISAFSEAEQKVLDKELTRLKPLRDKMKKGRVKNLDKQVAEVDRQIDAQEAIVGEKKKQQEKKVADLKAERKQLEKEKAQRVKAKKPIKAVDSALAKLDRDIQESKVDTKAQDKKVDRLLEARAVLDEERGAILTEEQATVEGTSGLLGKDITVKARDLGKANVQTTKESLQALKRGAAAKGKDVKTTQKSVLGILKAAKLPSLDPFVTALTQIQTKEQFEKAWPKLEQRINKVLEATRKKELTTALTKRVKQLRKSGTVAVDFVELAQELISAIDLKQRSPKSKARLEKRIAHFATEAGKQQLKGLDPKIIREMEAFSKKNIEDITSSELETLLTQVDKLISQGKKKLALMEQRKKRIQQQRLRDLAADSKPLTEKKTKQKSLGEQLNDADEIRNMYVKGRNRAARALLALNPMDVLFDMLDGSDKRYKGANHRIFKQTIDKAFHKYSLLKDKTLLPITTLGKKLKLTEANYERIGAWAALQQTGGEQKLLNSGITTKEIEALTLTPDELQMYEAMRKNLDSLVPQLKDTMRTLYNKGFKEEVDYFPFVTDFEAMSELELRDRFGSDAADVLAGDTLTSTQKKKNVAQGFSIKRVIGGDQKIKINAMEVFSGHIDNATYLVTMGEGIKTLGDLAGTQEYQDTVGDTGQMLVLEWIDLLARKGGSTAGKIPWLDVARRNTGLAILGYKLSTVLVQPTALMDGAALIGPEAVAKGVKHVTSKKWRQFLLDNMPEIKHRVGDDPAYLEFGGDASGSVLSSLAEGKKIKALKIGRAKTEQGAFWSMQQVDLLAASAVASGTYEKSVHERGGVVDLDNPDPIALEEAQLMMRRTQSSALAKDAPLAITAGGLTGNKSVDKTILQFQSFMLNRWSVLKHDMYGAGFKQGNIKQGVNIATWLILANFSEVGLRRFSKEIVAAVSGYDIDPWDEEQREKELVHSLLGNVPIVSQAMSTWEYGSAPVPAASMVEKVMDSVAYAKKSKSSEKKLKHATSAGLTAAGLFLGVPGTFQADQIIKKKLDSK